MQMFKVHVFHQAEDGKNLKLEKIEDLQDNIIQLISFRRNHFIFLTNNNEVFVYGTNHFGQLGLDGSEDKVANESTLKKIDFNFGKIIHLASSDFFTIIVNTDNEFFISGKFGTAKSSSFMKMGGIKILEKINLIKCGDNYLFIVTDKSIYGIGDNKHGQLGLGKKVHRNFNEITLIEDLKIKDISCMLWHALFLDKNGRVFVSGYNFYGQLGLGDDFNRYKLTDLNFPFKIIKISTSMFNSLILTNYYEVYTCGHNLVGSLGLGDNKNRSIFTKIVIDNLEGEFVNNIYDCFNDFNMISTNNNNVYVCGSNGFLGIDTQLCNVDLSRFRKYFNYKERFFFPILMRHLSFNIYSNEYQVNEIRDENLLGLQCLQKLNHFVDIIVKL